MHTRLFAAAAMTAALSLGHAHASFIVDAACKPNSCPGGQQIFLDNAVKGESDFFVTVGGHSGPRVDILTVGPVDSAAGFANFSPSDPVNAPLVSITFTPVDGELFSDFDFRGQIEPTDVNPITVNVHWVGALGDSGTIPFTIKKADIDFHALGIISEDGDTLTSVQITAANPPSFKEVKQIEFSFGEGTPVPEPASLALLGFGLLGLIGLRSRR